MAQGLNCRMLRKFRNTAVVLALRLRDFALTSSRLKASGLDTGQIIHLAKNGNIASHEQKSSQVRIQAANVLSVSVLRMQDVRLWEALAFGLYRCYVSRTVVVGWGPWFDLRHLAHRYGAHHLWSSRLHLHNCLRAKHDKAQVLVLGMGIQVLGSYDCYDSFWLALELFRIRVMIAATRAGP